MAQILANELKKKIYILIDSHPYVVIDVQFATPSARGASTMVRVKVRSLLSGAVQEKTFKTSEKFEEPDVEKSSVQFLYAEQDNYHFMDSETYDQFSLRKDQIKDEWPYLIENMEAQALKFNGEVVSLELPVIVELKVKETEPAIKGASASGRSTKKAVLETGLETQVPLYVEPGTAVRVNTQTGEVSGRA